LADIPANTRRGKKATPIWPIALEAVKRIDALFDIEREINGLLVEKRLAAPGEERRPGRRARSPDARRARQALAPCRGRQGDRLHAHALGSLHPLPLHGRICLTNNAAERALRGLALGRKSWLFAGSERGAERAALMYTLVQTAKLNDIDPQAWLANVLARMADTPQTKLADLLPMELGRRTPPPQSRITAPYAGWLLHIHQNDLCHTG
jgi:transposase